MQEVETTFSKKTTDIKFDVNVTDSKIHYEKSSTSILVRVSLIAGSSRFPLITFRFDPLFLPEVSS